MVKMKVDAYRERYETEEAARVKAKRIARAERKAENAINIAHDVAEYVKTLTPAQLVEYKTLLNK